MARVKRGVQARARHKKVIKQAKGYRGRSKMFLGLLQRRSKRDCNMLIGIEEQKKEILEVFGYKELMPVLGNTA